MILNKYLQCNPNMDVLLFHEDLQKPSKSIETSKKSLLEIFCMVTLNILIVDSEIHEGFTTKYRETPPG